MSFHVNGNNGFKFMFVVDFCIEFSAISFYKKCMLSRKVKTDYIVNVRSENLTIIEQKRTIYNIFKSASFVHVLNLFYKFCAFF